MSEEPRRALPIEIVWNGDLIGRVSVGGEYWGAVEWSEKHQQWCIEDAEGRCLSHMSHVHGRAAAKDEAVALAEAMIRDGRLPTPEAASAARRARREKRRNQPAQIRRRAERQRADHHRSDLMTRAWQANLQESAEPLYEMLAAVFDFADPELWKSNSFAALRPRLAAHVGAAVAKLESDLAWAEHRAQAEPFAMYRSAQQRQTARERRRQHGGRECRQIADKLDRARRILVQLEAPA
jgi:hypothetical protein